MKIFILASACLLFCSLTPQAFAASASEISSSGNPHYLSNKEYKAWKILCAKIDNDIDALHRRINVLKDLQNRRAKPEEIAALAAAIRSGAEQVFDEVNGHLIDRKLFKEDTKMFMGKLDAVRRSLDNLHV